MTKQDLLEISEIIKRKLAKEFSVHYLSKNLLNTIYVEQTEDSVKIHIPAEMYDMWEYITKGTIRYTHEGSYASQLNEKSKNHTGYIDRIVNESIQEWLGKNSDYILAGKQG